MYTKINPKKFFHKWFREKKRNSVYNKQSFIVHQFTFMTLTITATLQGPSCWRMGIPRWAPGNLEDWISLANLLGQHHSVESWFFWFSHVKNVSVFPFCHGFAPLVSSYQLFIILYDTKSASAFDEKSVWLYRSNLVNFGQI